MSPWTGMVDVPPDARWSRLKVACNKAHHDVELACLSTFNGIDVYTQGAYIEEVPVGSWQPSQSERTAAEAIGLTVPAGAETPNTPVHFQYVLSCPSCSNHPRFNADTWYRLHDALRAMWGLGLAEYVEHDVESRLGGDPERPPTV